MKWSDRIQIRKKYANSFIGFICLLIFFLPAFARASGDYELTWSTITGGGGQSSNGSYALIGAVGSFSTIISSPNPYAPMPNPMEWATVPYATRSSSISMMAANANDPTGGVEYYFENVTIADGSHDSGWQSQRTYTDNNLDPNTTYEYRVKAHDAEGHETDWSVTFSAKTHPESGAHPEGATEPVSGELGNDLNLGVDTFMGSVMYSVPIVVPPGRQGSEPKLSLNYSSGGGNGWCGLGWSIGMGAIQRDTHKGVPVARNGATFLSEYDDDKGFVVAFGAVNSKLVLVDEVNNEYRAETDQAFFKYIFDSANNLWTVTDKNGNKFFFGEIEGEFVGETAGAVMQHPQFDSAVAGNNVFQWALAKIQDINGNLTYIYYTMDSGQIYLDEVRYNGHVFGPTEASGKVKFELEERSDRSFSYASGYRIENNKRLKDIRITFDTYSVRRYHLEYDQSTSTSRSLLKSVTLYGADDESNLPPIQFNYTVKPTEFENPISWGPLDSQSTGADWNSPVATDVSGETHIYYCEGIMTGEIFYAYVPFFHHKTHVSLVDLNGDALPDRVMRNYTGFTSPDNNVFKVQLNTGSAFSSCSDWGPLDSQGHESDWQSALWNSPKATWSDIYTGVWSRSFESHYNPSTGQFEYIDHANYDCQFGDDVSVDILDINGDGYADRVMRKSELMYLPNNNVFKVQFNNGTNFSSSYDWGPLDACGYFYDTTPYPTSLVHSGQARLYNSIRGNYSGEDGSPTFVDLLDMNGDGLPDRVFCDDRLYPWGSFKVQFNSGEGFEHVGGTQVITNWGPIDGQGSTHYMWISISSTGTGEDTITDLFDINGDGLPDRVMRKINAPFNWFKVQFNTGYGFEKDSNGAAVLRDWGPLNSQGETNPTWNTIQAVDQDQPIMQDQKTVFVDMFDINGDGLADRVMRKKDAPYDAFKVQINTGSGFQIDSQGQGVIVDWEGVQDLGTGIASWASPHGVNKPQQVDSDTYVTMCDMNGDGLLDRLLRKVDTPYDVFKVQLNKGPLPDMLSQVVGKFGGSVEIQYVPSTQYDNRDHNGVHRLPFPAYTVSQIAVDDGLGTQGITTYEYERGYFNGQQREFRGFGKVSVTDPEGVKTITYFHQGGGYDDQNKGEFEDTDAVAKRGIPYRVEVYGNNGLLYRLIQNKVIENEIEADTGWYFAYISQTMSLIYEGLAFNPELDNYTSDYRAEIRQFEYDIVGKTGNILETIDLGEVRIGEEAAVIADNLKAHTWTQNVTVEDDLYTHVSYATDFWDGQNWIQKPEIINKIEHVWITSDPTGNNTIKADYYLYDDRGQMIKEQAWLDKTANGPLDSGNGIYTTAKEYGYDIYGNCDWTKDKAGTETTIEYDSIYHMYPVAKTTGAFFSTTDYDFRSGLPVETVDPAGFKTWTYYDNFYRVTEEWISLVPNEDLAFQQTQITYHIAGIDNGESQNWIHQVHGGYESFLFNDGLGRVFQRRLKAEAETGYDYRVTNICFDSSGKIRYESQPFFADNTLTASPDDTLPGTTTEYDAIGRVWRLTPPTGELDSPTGPTTTVYGIGPGVTSHTKTDPEGNVIKKHLDIQGRVIQLIESNDGVESTTCYQYDRLGRLINITDPYFNEIIKEYDSQDRKIRSIDPDMGQWMYFYDDFGRMTEQTDERGNRTSLTYDQYGRIETKQVYNSSQILEETISYTYDQSDDPSYIVHKGKIYKVTDNQGWSKTGYDSRGRAIKSTRYLSENEQTYTIHTFYDDADRIKEVVYPDNIAGVVYDYDLASHMIKVECWRGTGEMEIIYEARNFNRFDQPEQFIFGNGVVTEREFYNSNNRLKRIYTQREQTGIQDLHYTYDKVSNVLNVYDYIHTTGQNSSTLTNIQYDDMYRLSSVHSIGQAQTFTYEYDAIGNIVLNGEMGASQYIYSGTKPHAVISANANTYDYDACGNMTMRNSILYGNQTLNYDSQNRLSSLQVAGGSNNVFGYSADNERLWKKVDDQIVNIKIGKYFEVKENKELCHVYAGQKLVASFEPQPTADSIFYYYHNDHLDSSSLITNREGEEVKQYLYSPFGYEHYNEPSENFDVSNRYTSQIFDEEIGLYYYGARYYDPELARFIQPDSVVPEEFNSQALNRYSYSFNNPLRFNDPSGNYPFYTGYDQGISYEGMVTGAYYGAMQAGMSGGNMLMGAYVGAINGASGNALIATTNSGATYLTSILTGSFNQTTSEWSPITYDFSHGSDSPVDWGQFGKEVGKEAGHIALDAAGMSEIPIVAQSAEIANASWYASERRWGEAAISLVSILPVDILVKPGKYGTRALSSSDNVLRFADEGAGVVKRGWKRGDPITNLTRSGDVPSWPTIRRRYWKNEALYNAGDYTSDNLRRMRRGLAEQQRNPVTGALESRHLHHNPPQSQGNLFDFTKKWPEEHGQIHQRR